MFTFFSPFLISLVSKALLVMLLVGAAAPAAAHTYFFGVSELNINPESNHIEVIHQFTAHDIENTIAEIKQVRFSPEHPQYDQLIQWYIEQHFILEQKNQIINMNWIGFEIKRGQLFAYQESISKQHLANLVVKNSVLIDTYIEQINTVNYQDLRSTDSVEGSLTFDQSSSIAIIKLNK